MKRQFDVESKYYPGQAHKWVLARFLQKGHQNTSISFFNVLRFILNRFIALLVISKHPMTSQLVWCFLDESEYLNPFTTMRELQEVLKNQ